MSTFLKARQTLTVAMTAFGFGIAIALIGEHPLPLPFVNLVGPGELFTKLVLPLLPATATVWSLAAARTVEERTAVRPLRWYTAAFVWASITLYSLIALVAQSITGGSDPLTVVRNTLGYIGLAALLAALLDPVAAAAATVLISLFSLTFGRLPSGALSPAAWPIVPSHSGEAWAVAAGLALAGTTVFLTRRC